MDTAPPEGHKAIIVEFTRRSNLNALHDFCAKLGWALSILTLKLLLEAMQYIQDSNAIQMLTDKRFREHGVHWAEEIRELISCHRSFSW